MLWREREKEGESVWERESAGIRVQEFPNRNITPESMGIQQMSGNQASNTSAGL